MEGILIMAFGVFVVAAFFIAAILSGSKETNNEEKNMKSEEITNRFFYHPPTPEQAKVHGDLSILFANLATQVNKLIPDSREKAIVFTKLEEAKFFASAAVARRDENSK